jgi:hypothetical protein
MPSASKQIAHRSASTEDAEQNTAVDKFGLELGQHVKAQQRRKILQAVHRSQHHGGQARRLYSGRYCRYRESIAPSAGLNLFT